METELHLIVTGYGFTDQRELLSHVRNALALSGLTVLEAEVIPPAVSVRVYRDETIRAGLPDSLRCPTCNSPQPSMHPATSAGGEVCHICPDRWHGLPEDVPQVAGLMTEDKPKGAGHELAH